MKPKNQNQSRTGTEKYIMDDNGNVVFEPDLFKWADWFEKNVTSEKRIVRQDKVGKKFLSTVFLSLDYSFGGNVPILFETMLFDGDEPGELIGRYATKDEAIEGHEVALKHLGIMM